MRPLDPAKFLADTLRPYALGEKTGVPGLFERYLLDSADNDDAAITERLAAVKAIWDKAVEHARYGELAKALSKEHDDASMTLLDPSERARLAAAAQNEAEQAAREAQAALADWRRMLADADARGGLTSTTRATLERIAKNAGLDPELVEAELGRARAAAPPSAMPAEVREKIRRSLRDLGRAVGEERLALSLYHALGLEGITADLALVKR